MNIAVGPSWTDERVTDLRKLAAFGLSASQIAADLGGISRNAVIGKMMRMGIKSVGTRSQKAISGAARRVHRRRPVEAGNQECRATEIPQNKNTRCTIMDLNLSTCRWPIGDKPAYDMLYCGAQIAFVGCSYCSFHRRLATTARRRA